ncbi:MAG: glycosyl hydrolase family 57, partial [Hydrococcus sp. SU_1_0]|nr:glycosyl hydrolase family 57 [Hydrococcus sp. SU_1_0]
MSPATAQRNQLSVLTNGLPNICGWESEVAIAVNHDQPIFLPHSKVDLSQVNAAFACALHMHQPTIPAGANGELICNLQHIDF